MGEAERPAGMVPALLKHWRRQRGLSQLDLAIAADVSARHVSFLETGRSLPSPEMVLRLGATLGVPLRQVNTMLRAAGHEPVYDESETELPAAVAEAISLLERHHEPFPLVVVDHRYRVRSLNRGAQRLLGALLGLDIPAAGLDATTVEAMDLNLARLTFHPALAHGVIANFDEVGRELLWRIQREVLADPDDLDLGELLDDLLAAGTVPADWREVDLSVPSEPALVLHLRHEGTDLRFLTTVTAFQAPQNVAVEHLRIETWFPYDDATAAACRALTDAEL